MQGVCFVRLISGASVTPGMAYSHRKSGQPGKITRLMSCTDEQWEAFPDKDLVPTHRVGGCIGQTGSRTPSNKHQLQSIPSCCIVILAIPWRPASS